MLRPVPLGDESSMADAAEPLLTTADGRPLKAALADAQARAKRRAFLLVLPLLCFVLLTESLARDWHLAEVRLLNALIGVALALTVALLVHGLRVHLSKTVTTTATPEKPS